MPGFSKAGGGLAVSFTELANEFNFTRETVSKRVNAAGLEPIGKAVGRPTYRMRDAVKAILGISVERKDVCGINDEPAGQDPASLPPFERNAWMRSERERLKMLAEKRELLPAAEFESELARVLKLMVQVLDTLGDRLERECALSPEVVERVGVVTSELRAELHAAITESGE